MGLENAFEHLGNFGLFQIRTFVLTGLFGMVTVNWQLASINFKGAATTHYCRPPPNGTTEDWLPVSEYKDGRPVFEQCKMYQQPNRSVDNNTDKCKYGWQHYAQEPFSEDNGTITMEWDLVCENGIYRQISQTCFNVGNLIGFFFATPLADRFGRKKLMFGSQLLMCTFGVANALSPNMWVFTLFMSFVGIFATSLYAVAAVICTEVFTTQIRTLLTPMVSIFVAFAFATASLWSAAIPHWRWFQLAISLTGFPMLLYWFWCPESIRWIISVGRVEEAQELLRHAAATNNCSIPEEVLNSLEEQEQEVSEVPAESESSLSVFCTYVKSPWPLTYMLVVCFLMFTSQLTYQGSGYLMGSLPGGLHLNFLINALVDIPGILLSITIVHVWGRKHMMWSFFLLAAVAALVGAIVTGIHGPGTTLTVMCYIGKFANSGLFANEILLVQEIFPTKIRGSGAGLCLGVGFLGGVVAPYLPVLYDSVKWLPSTLLGILAGLSAMTVFLLPETNGRDLPTTVEDVKSWPKWLSQEELLLFRSKNKMICKKRPIDDKTTVEQAYVVACHSNQDEQLGGTPHYITEDPKVAEETIVAKL